MNTIVSSYLSQVHLPQKDSHKGRNGKLLIIGGSSLFHAASIWSLRVASRMVDLVHYSSTSENNKIVQKLKESFLDGIVIPRLDIENYINEDDCILIGPGMVRTDEKMPKVDYILKTIKEIDEIQNEGILTYHLTKYLLTKYPTKKWVIDAGSLQMVELSWIPKNTILTPHHKEFETLKGKIVDEKKRNQLNSLPIKEQVQWFAKEYECVVILKGERDIIASKDVCIEVEGGNAGMTKGGTGDVLSGVVASLYCGNEAFTSAVVGSYINKKAGDDLYTTSGFWFNASDLANQIPKTMKNILLKE